MSIGGERIRTPRWFVFAMGLLTLVVAALCLALCWVLAAQGTFVAKALLWAALVGFGLVSAALGLIGLVRYHAIQLCLAAPLFIGILAALVWYEIPERAGWEVTRGILEDQAVECAHPGERTRLGVYLVRFVERRDGGCLFYTEGADLDWSGFAYFPDSPPPVLGRPQGPGIGYEAFDGDWYRFTENS
ncbi:hypothetical protein [Nocardia sp. XZ_19_385]|uniref:hypothetical protein n=1 Tax=Nocardia sp. XZ_19_385 TaxID=2769488 RepID=UPI0018909340|nr:hypothetical protein [Nocardia sp. XZ_19_385]